MLLRKELAAKKVREDELHAHILELDCELTREATESVRLAGELVEMREKMKMYARHPKVVKDKTLRKVVYELRLSQIDLNRIIDEESENEDERTRKEQIHLPVYE